MMNWSYNMCAKYKNVDEIYDLLRSFEDGSVARDVWKHAEHLVVALCYLEEHDLETASKKMRDGIFDLLRNGFGVDLTKEMPYHETLTVFWMRTVLAYSLLMKDASLLEKANGIVDLFDKDYPLRFYSKEFLFSDRARTEFVEPDLGFGEYFEQVLTGAAL